MAVKLYPKIVEDYHNFYPHQLIDPQRIFEIKCISEQDGNNVQLWHHAIDEDRPTTSLLFFWSNQDALAAYKGLLIRGGNWLEVFG